MVRSRASVRLEIIALQHQLAVVHRSRRPRLRLTSADRALWAWLSQAWDGWRSARDPPSSRKQSSHGSGLMTSIGSHFMISALYLIDEAFYYFQCLSYTITTANVSTLTMMQQRLSSRPLN